MAKNLRWKILVIVGVIALSVYTFYPPDQKVRLGLDLKGGVHLVMRVQTDDAVRLETETTSDRLREQMKAQNIAGTVTTVSPTEFRVEGVSPEQDAAFRQLLTDTEALFNRAPGAGSYTFTMRPNLANQLLPAILCSAGYALFGVGLLAMAGSKSHQRLAHERERLTQLEAMLDAELAAEAATAEAAIAPDPSADPTPS